MHEALVSFNLLLDKIVKFINSQQAATIDIEHAIQTQGESRDKNFDRTVTIIADMLSLKNDKDFVVLKASLQQFISFYQQSLQELKNANAKIDSIITCAQNEFIEDMRAEFNMLALNEYGILVIDNTKKALARIDIVYQADVDEINWLTKQLKKELPDNMSSVATYAGSEALLDQVKRAICENNTEINEVNVELNQHAGFMRECMHKTKNINVSERINACIKKSIFLTNIADAEISKILFQIHDSLKKLNKTYQVEFKLSGINAISIDNLFEDYTDLLEEISLLKLNFINKNYFSFSLEKELNSKLINDLNQLKSYKTAISVAEAALAKQKENYNLAYQSSYDAIQNLGDLAKAKLKNESYLQDIIPAMEKTIAERKRVKLREDNYLVERYQFENGIYQNVNKEGFVKIKERFLYTGESKNIINDLFKHANGHMSKGGLIKSLVTFIENAVSLADLIGIVETAMHRRDLIECKTEMGRKFGIISTTGRLIKKLDIELKKLIMDERKTHKSFDSIKITIEEDKNAVFSDNLTFNFGVIYKDFLEGIGKSVNVDPTIQSLKEELVSISLWSGPNDSKNARMTVAIDHAKKVLAKQGSEQANAISRALNRFLLNHHQALKTVHHQQQICPFSYRYQELKKRLATVKTLRQKTLDDLWTAIDHVAASDDDEVRKLEGMRNVLYRYYCGIRESSRGSPGYLFGNGSRLAAALGEFLVAKEGFFMRATDVPPRIGFRL